MRISKHWLIPLLSTATACGGSGSTSPDADARDAAAQYGAPAMPAELQVVNLLYDNSFSAPDGFYVDERAATERSYSLHHVLDESASYELCTDDFAVAMDWEAADNAQRSVQGYFVEAFESARYFEVARELNYENEVGNVDDITSPGFARVFKCRNTSRDGVDRLQLNGFAGQLNEQPLTAESIRVFTEYLWQFSFFPNSREKVIATFSSQDSDALRHTLRVAFATSQGDGNCDLIEVVDWQFSVLRVTGEVSRRFELRQRFEARHEAGINTICN